MHDDVRPSPVVAARAELLARISIAASFVLAVAFVWGFYAVKRAGETSGSTLRAPLRVVDERGQTIVEIRRTDMGPALWLNSADGQTVAAINGSKSGGSLAVFTETGAAAVTISAFPKPGGNVIVWSTENGAKLAHLAGRPEGGRIDMWGNNKGFNPLASLIAGPTNGELHLTPEGDNAN